MPDLDEIRAGLARIPNPVSVLENLFARAPVGLQIYEASGRSVLVNQAFLDLFGTEPPPGYNVLRDEIAEENGVLDLIHRAFKGETVTVPPVWYDPRELRQVKVETGNRIAFSATFVPLTDHRTGAVTHVAIIFRDMTAELLHRAQLEEERREREAELQRQAEFRERFIGILAHDLRSPLSAVLGSAALIQKHEGLPERVTNSAVRIASSAGRMGRMIADLLDFTEARLGGGLSVQRRPCDLHELAQTAIDELLAAHPGREIRLRREGETRGEFDADRVLQLLANLLMNAVTHGPAGQPIEVVVRDASIEIANAGPMVPEAERETIFDPFRRGASVGAQRGLGLGLYIARQIARAHGGDVSLESEPGRTLFRATLHRS